MKIRNLKLTGIFALATLLSVAADADSISFGAKLPAFAPLKEAQPIYPQRALDRKISGYALVKYSIDANGRTSDISVVESEPAGVFNMASKRAVQRTKYDRDDAVTVGDDAFYRLYVYELDEANPNQLALSK